MPTPSRVIGRNFYRAHRERLISERNTVEAKAARGLYWARYWAIHGDEIRERRRQKAARQRAARPRTSV